MSHSPANASAKTARRPVRGLVAAALAALLAACAARPATAETDPQRVARQFREYCLAETPDDDQRPLKDVETSQVSPAEALRQLDAQKPDGSWPDLDYASQAPSSWPPSTHMMRLLGLAVHAHRAGTPVPERARCLQAVHRGLEFWIPRDFRCTNWWYNEIGGPKTFAMIALILGDDLQPAERDYIAGKVLPRSKIGARTGQNRVWLTGNALLLAALQNDEALLKKAAAILQEELRVGTDEGIQPDWSFHQHGPQQQLGNYGMAYAAEMTRWASVLRGTALAFPDDKLAILRNYLLQGHNWISWRGAMDISSCGRQLFPGSPRGKTDVIRSAMRTLAAADPARAPEYRAFLARNADDNAPNDLVGNRFFWRSDYLVHRRPQAMATLKMHSSRVIGCETVNHENLSGLHLADGVTLFYRSGREYENIFPLWDWRKLPGITAPQSDASLRCPGQIDPKQGAFVGGVSDGQSASAAMDFRRDGLAARKSWFFAGDAVICLGTRINSDQADPVLTTLNQCLARGNVTLVLGDKREPFAGPERKFTADAGTRLAVEHDGWRYASLQPQAMTLSLAERTGNWSSVFSNPATPRRDLKNNIFTLTIDHGPRPAGGSYAYAVTPAADPPPALKVLANSDTLQAVKAGDGWIGAVFWSAGKADLDGCAVEVDAPCLLLVTGAGAARRITVSDPTQKLPALRITLDGTLRAVRLPRGGEAGRSVLVNTPAAGSDPGG